MTDMNGDGIPDMQLTTDDDGTMHMENFDADGNLRSYYIKYPDGSSHRLSDTNGDGNTDIQEDYTISPHRQIILTDRNYDGFPEERRTADFDYDNALMTVTEERDDEGKGNYVIIKKWSQKIITMRRAQEDKNGRLESNSDLKKTPTSRPMKSALLSSSTAMTLNMKNYLMPLTVPLDMEAIVFMR